jgi:hypothetical protein
MSITPQQVSIYPPTSSEADGQAGQQQQAIKTSSAPDVSFCFAERGFSRATDRVVWWSVCVDSFTDECRVGFTDDVESLMRREAFMSYEEPRLWCYNDGSMVRGVHGGGRHLSRDCPRFQPGDVVTVCIDFERNCACWFLNLASAAGASLAYAMRSLPSQDGAEPRELRAAIVLDEGGDTVRYRPLVSAPERRRGERLMQVMEWIEAAGATTQEASGDHSGEADSPMAHADLLALNAAYHEKVEARAYIASRFVQEVEPTLHETIFDELPSAAASRRHLFRLFIGWLCDVRTDVAAIRHNQPWVHSHRGERHLGAEFLGWVPSDEDDDA